VMTGEIDLRGTANHSASRSAHQTQPFRVYRGRRSVWRL